VCRAIESFVDQTFLSEVLLVSAAQRLLRAVQPEQLE